MDIPILNNILSNDINTTSLPVNNTLPSHNTSLPTHNTSLPNKDDGKSIFAVFHMFISILAVYLALRCNPKINYTSILLILLSIITINKKKQSIFYIKIF